MKEWFQDLVYFNFLVDLGEIILVLVYEKLNCYVTY